MIVWLPGFLREIVVWLPTSLRYSRLTSWAGYYRRWARCFSLWVRALSLCMVWPLSVCILSLSSFSWVHMCSPTFLESTFIHFVLWAFQPARSRFYSSQSHQEYLHWCWVHLPSKGSIICEQSCCLAALPAMVHHPLCSGHNHLRYKWPCASFTELQWVSHTECYYMHRDKYLSIFSHVFLTEKLCSW